ncbi:protoglobin domain-containing protein [Acidocella sp.]|uniref:protoglobin domain-containing protein n=1 Tax=Acidocella sp. TaxID=50710 RepID=UPI00262E5407|nr:protoglobin domain-containing protein [Acidocella sp.]
MSGFHNKSGAAAKVIAVLQDLVAEARIIEAAALVGRDGQIIAHATRANAGPEALFTAVDELLGPDSAHLRHLGQGTLGQVVESAASRRVMIRQAGPNALVCTVSGGYGRGGSQLPSISGTALRLAELAQIIPPPLPKAPPAEPAPDPFPGLRLPDLPACPLTAEDCARIGALRPFVMGVLPGVTRKIYDAMEAEPQMARHMPNGTARLRDMHMAWLETLFTGDYGALFAQRQLQIGQAHQLAGIPPVLLAATMAYLRAILPPALRGALGEGVLSEIAIGTVMRLVDYAFALMDTNSSGLITRIGGA